MVKAVHYIFAIDISGNTAGSNNERAKSALNKGLETLRAANLDAYFSIIVFGEAANAVLTKSPINNNKIAYPSEAPDDGAMNFAIMTKQILTIAKLGVPFQTTVISKLIIYGYPTDATKTWSESCSNMKEFYRAYG